MLELGALDAFIAGLSTAFFGALVAGGAYLLRQQMALRETVDTLAVRVERMGGLERLLQSLDQEKGERLKPRRRKREGDARAK